jgi:hypothetical protein
MSHSRERTITEHSPLFQPTIPAEQIAAQSRANDEATVRASREAAEREAAYVQALSGIPPTPQRPPLQLRQPALPSDFADALDRFDNEIFARGIAINRQKLLELGRKRFLELLALDRQARTEQRVIGTNCDLTSWPSVADALANISALNAGIPRRKTAEVWIGAGEDREQAGQFAGFADLWKSATEPRAVRAIYAFHDKFASLLLGMSLLDRISDDGKIHSRFFCAGKPAGRFIDWLSVLEQPHIAVTLLDPVGDLICWLANESTPPPRPLEFARDLFGVRAPSAEQVKVAAAAWRAFALGYVSAWDIWNFVGRETRVRTEPTTPEIWRKGLAMRYPGVERFHLALRAYFYKPVEGNQFHFEERAHRLFIDANIRKLANRVTGRVAMAVEEVLPQSVAARFFDSILAATDDRSRQKLDACVYEKLAKAFPRSDFQFRITQA